MIYFRNHLILSKSFLINHSFSTVIVLPLCRIVILCNDVIKENMLFDSPPCVFVLNAGTRDIFFAAKASRVSTDATCSCSTPSETHHGLLFKEWHQRVGLLPRGLFPPLYQQPLTIPNFH